MDYQEDATRIVDALINDNEEIFMPPKTPASSKEEEARRKHPKAVGRDAYVRPQELPHCRTCGSRTHTTANCPHQGSHII